MDTTILLYWLGIVFGKGYGLLPTRQFFVTPESGNWSSSKSNCESRQGRIITIDSWNKFFLIKTFIWPFQLQNGSNGRMFVGLSTRSKNCTNYIWSSGKALDVSFWDESINEPNNCELEQCVTMPVFGGYRTTACHLRLKAICEYVNQETSSPTSSLATTTNTTASVVTQESSTTNTMTSAVSTSFPTSHPVTDDSTCDCCTSRHTNITEYSQTELLQIITQLKAELSVSKNNTSSYRRKRISTYEFEARPSSLVMGGVACVIISIMIGWIVVPDTITLCVFLFKSVNKPNAIRPRV